MEKSVQDCSVVRSARARGTRQCWRERNLAARGKQSSSNVPQVRLDPDVSRY